MLTRSVGDEGVILQGKLVNIPDTDCIRVTGPAIKRRAKWHRICNLLGLCDLFLGTFEKNIWFDFIGNVENIVTITFLIISKLTQFSAKQNANVWNVPGLLIVSDQDEKKHIWQFSLYSSPFFVGVSRPTEKNCVALLSPFWMLIFGYWRMKKRETKSFLCGTLFESPKGPKRRRYVKNSIITQGLIW